MDKGQLKNMETSGTNKVIETLKDLIQLQKDKIQLQKDKIQLQDERMQLKDEQVQTQREYINILQKQLAEQKQKFINARWIAIYEFLTFFMETKGEIYDSNYLQSAFKLIDLPLTENNVYWMLEYAAEHLKYDAEKQILGK